METAKDFLERVGLGQYAEKFIEEGYEDAESFAELTEEELIDDLGMKKGHAKKLLKKIAEETGAAASPSSPPALPEKNTPAPAQDDAAGSAAAPAPADAESGKGKKKKRKGTKSGGAHGASDAGADEDDAEASDHEFVGEDMAGKKTEMEGFLHKKGDKGKIKLWRKRYFRLYPELQCMSYFKDDKTTVETGRINLRGALVAEDFSGRKNGFAITMKTSARVWYLGAPTPDDLKKWMEACEKFITTPEAPPPGKFELKVPTCQYAEPKEERVTSRHDEPASFDCEQVPFEDGAVHLYLVGNKAAYVHERRKLTLDDQASCWVDGLPSQTKPDSLLFRALEPAGAIVDEQRWFNDKRSPQELLGRLQGKLISVTVSRSEEGAPRAPDAQFEGKLEYQLGADQFALHDEAGDTVHFLRCSDLVSFTLKDKLDDGQPLFRGPAVHWRLIGDAQPGGEVQCEFFYSMGAVFKWSAVYSAVLNAKESTLDLNGYYVAENLTDRAFENATLVLVSDPQALADRAKAPASDDADDGGAADGAPAAPAKTGFFSRFKPKMPSMPALPGGLGNLLGGNADLDKVRLYYPEQRPTLAPKSATGRPVHLRLVQGTQVPVRSYYLVRFDLPKFKAMPDTNGKSGTKCKASVQSVIEFKNSEATHAALGRPLPEGSLKLLRREKSGFGARQLAAVSVPHVDQDDMVTLAFETVDGIGVQRKQLGFNYDSQKRILVEEFEVTLTNGTTIDSDIVLEDSLWRAPEWEVPAESHPHKAHPDHERKVVWNFSLEKLIGKVTLTYTVFYANVDLPKADDSEDEEDGPGDN